MTTKEKAAEIRKALKAQLGYGPGQVYVTTTSLMGNDYINLDSKSPAVNDALVWELAETFSQKTPILPKGNLYLRVGKYINWNGKP